MRALVVSKHLTNLTSLSLAYNRIGDGGVRALAEAPLLGQLTYLDLSHNTIRAAGARVRSPVLWKNWLEVSMACACGDWT